MCLSTVAGEDPASLEITVEPASDRYDTHDERWRAQVAALCNDLKRNVGKVRMESTPTAGEKGAAADIILALGSSGALTSAVAMFRAWLGRDKSRSLAISWTHGDERRTVSIRGTDFDEEDFADLAKAAVRSSSGG